METYFAKIQKILTSLNQTMNSENQIIVHVVCLSHSYHELDFFETPFVCCFLFDLTDFYSTYAFVVLL